MKKQTALRVPIENEGEKNKRRKKRERKVFHYVFEEIINILLKNEKENSINPTFKTGTRARSLACGQEGCRGKYENHTKISNRGRGPC